MIVPEPNGRVVSKKGMTLAPGAAGSLWLVKLTVKTDVCAEAARAAIKAAPTSNTTIQRLLMRDPPVGGI